MSQMERSYLQNHSGELLTSQRPLCDFYKSIVVELLAINFLNLCNNFGILEGLNKATNILLEFVPGLFTLFFLPRLNS